jgi:hypothetical protein
MFWKLAACREHYTNLLFAAGHRSSDKNTVSIPIDGDQLCLTGLTNKQI